ncbi:MAG: molybdopterin molybdenumtransferase MoeA, partial [Rhodoglobus sp.]
PDGRLVVCLPGNPLAAMIAAITICEPVIAGLAGRAVRPTRQVRGIDVDGRAGSTLLKPFTMTDGLVTLTRWQGSGMMRGLADAHGLLVVPEHGTTDGMPAESVDLPWLQLASGDER